MKLNSKIQYRSFETGEFTEEKERTFEEVIQLIEHFPWEEQRTDIVIDLTNPSVIIQGKNKDYLKLSLFYNGKFALRYFDSTQKLYTKSLSHSEQSYDDIRRFFETPYFQTNGFKKENTIFQRNLKHFLSQDFHYEVTPRSAGWFLFSTSGINLFFTLFMVIALPLSWDLEFNLISISLFLLLFIVMGGAINFILFTRYYLYSKNKMLIMSKGNDEFYFGPKKKPIKYSKEDILQFSVTRIRNSKHTLSSFALVQIEFKNGLIIDIPNIFLDYTRLEEKLSTVPKVEIDDIPGIRI